MQQNMQPIRINRTRPVITFGLIALLVLVFVADAISSLFFGGYGLLTLYGIKVGTLISQGQWWRLLSANLLHADLMHIGANCLGLYIWGRYIEAFYGKGRYPCILLLSGLACTAASYAFTSSPSLGASGMVFGLYGALLGIRKFDKNLFNAIFGIQLLIFIGISVFWGFTGGHVDNFGHIGGLVGGFLSARMVGMLGEQRDSVRQLLYGAGYALFFSLCIYIGYAGLPF
ncbi:MAG: rhomboid family intramembrane serine protease [Eubacteriales bacterium]|nr:rhomboid family intramembrane serine protease [Eubacteriales bacterium]